MNMKRLTVVCVAAVSLAGSAFAQGKADQAGQQAQGKGTQAAQPTQAGQTGGQPGQAPAGDMAQMDLSKMGAPARKPTNEKQTKQEVTALFKALDDAMKKGDLEALYAAHDFPVFMATDDMKGVPETKMYSREEFIAEMGPMFQSMPKDLKMTHKPTITVLSDSLVNVVDDFTMTMGKQKVSGRNAGLLVKRDGKWLWKSMIEAGWGGMSAASGGAAAEGKK